MRRRGVVQNLGSPSLQLVVLLLLDPLSCLMRHQSGGGGRRRSRRKWGCQNNEMVMLGADCGCGGHDGENLRSDCAGSGGGGLCGKVRLLSGPWYGISVGPSCGCGWMLVARHEN